MPLAAGAGLSLLVLALAFFGQSWPGWPDRLGLVSDPPVVVGTIEDAVPPPASAGAAPVEPAPTVAHPAGAPGEPDFTAMPAHPASSTPLPSTPEAAPAGAAPATSTAAPERAAPPDSAPTRMRADDAESRLAALTVDPSSGGPTSEAAPSAALPQWPPIPLFRPQELAARIAPGEPAPADPATSKSPVVVPASFEEQPSEPPAHPAGIQVVINYTGTNIEDAAIARRLASFLQLRGFTVADLRPVNHRIGQARLRYFDPRDREQSTRLLEDVDWFFEGTPERTPDQAADFTRQQPKPPAGSVELWLPTS